MKNTDKRVPKSVLIKLLAVLGYKLERTTFLGRRMWSVSGATKGEYFSSLQAIFATYKKAKTNDLQMKIDPYVAQINRAIH